MPDTLHKTITDTSSARYTDRGSRFYAHAGPAIDSKSIDKFRTEITKKYPDASHHCYAWRLNPFQPQEFTQDDGEPGGTAGMPILSAIRSEKLINILVIVARYFGGTKLGKPGLIHAYREAAGSAIACAPKSALRKYVPYIVKYPYDQENRIRELVNRFQMHVRDEKYVETVTLTLYCLPEYSGELHGILRHLEYAGVQFQTRPESYQIDKQQE